MGNHTHEAGEVMASFRYMQVTMDGNRTGTNRIEPGGVLQSFPVAPLQMPMDR